MLPMLSDTIIYMASATKKNGRCIGKAASNSTGASGNMMAQLIIKFLISGITEVKMLLQRTAANFNIQYMDFFLFQVAELGNQSIFNIVRFKSAVSLLGFDMDNVFFPTLSVNSEAVPQKIMYPLFKMAMRLHKVSTSALLITGCTVFLPFTDLYCAAHCSTFPNGFTPSLEK